MKDLDLGFLCSSCHHVGFLRVFFFLLCILLIILYVFTGKEKKMCRKYKGEIRCHSLRRYRKAFDIFQYLLFLNILISVVLDVFFLYVYMNMCMCINFQNTGLFFLKTRFLKKITCFRHFSVLVNIYFYSRWLYHHLLCGYQSKSFLSKHWCHVTFQDYKQ